LDCHDKELSILFTDDEKIAKLNEQYRKKSGPTNVLAFSMEEGMDQGFASRMLGDVVISIDTALKEADDLGEPVASTIDRLLVHGVLHLLGFDHEASPKEAIRMEKEEKRLMSLIVEE
jgi:rRNA maturation RNase YbeY